MAEPISAEEIPSNLKAYILYKGHKVVPGQKKEKEKKEKGQRVVGGDRNAPVLERFDKGDFGDLALIQSGFKTNRSWTEIKNITPELAGKHIWVRARLHTVRGKGKIAFFILRRGLGSIQCILEESPTVSRDFIKFASKIYPESVVDVYAQVTNAAQDVKSTSQHNVELLVRKLYVVSLAAPELPFQMDDASRPQKKQTTKAGEPDETNLEPGHVGQKIRLDNRWLDLRTQANHAIFRIQSAVGQYFRQYFVELGFTEIHTPKICPGVSEGGSQVFRLGYFQRKACLAQSPQLYKQMAVISDLFNVFEIGPVFRAEDSNTYRHMCEFVGMDFEMEIKEHYHEILRTLANCFVYIFDALNTYHQPELEAVGRQYEYEPLVYLPKDQTPVIDFREAVKLLREAGQEIGDHDDFTTENEKALGKIIRAKYNTDFYFVDLWPLNVRPFYTMPSATVPGYTNSYDVFLRGEEITSGAQRIHDVELLKKRAAECGIPADNISKYVESFKYGAYPHGGGGVGLERVVLLFLGLDNIRKTSMFPRTPNRVEP